LLVGACQPQSDAANSDKIAFRELTQPTAEPIANKQSNKRPNILFVVVDDMGMVDIGGFGDEIDTPNLDKPAHNGGQLNSK